MFIAYAKLGRIQPRFSLSRGMHTSHQEIKESPQAAFKTVHLIQISF